MTTATSKIDEMRMNKQGFELLVPISHKLRKIFERQCNGYSDTDWGRKQGARDNGKEVKLITEAERIAKEYFGLSVYIQTDPRGCALYLIENAKDEYTNGIAIY